MSRRLIRLGRLFQLHLHEHIIIIFTKLYAPLLFCQYLKSIWAVLYNIIYVIANQFVQISWTGFGTVAVVVWPADRYCQYISPMYRSYTNTSIFFCRNASSKRLYRFSIGRRSPQCGLWLSCGNENSEYIYIYMYYLRIRRNNILWLWRVRARRRNCVIVRR